MTFAELLLLLGVAGGAGAICSLVLAALMRRLVPAPVTDRD